jgi:quercetin dioxygenase-like cupin family protein
MAPVQRISAGVRGSADDAGRDPKVRKVSLDAIAREQLEAAGRAGSARASTTVVGGHEHVMRQTVIALTAGAALAEHENPGEATLYVIVGRVDLQVGNDTWQARTGDLVEIPPARHSVIAIEDSAVLLTAVPRGNRT